MAGGRVREDVKGLSGSEKAALFILSLGEDYAARIFLPYERRRDQGFVAGDGRVWAMSSSRW